MSPIVFYKLYVSVREAAEYMSVSTRKVYALIRKGELNKYKAGARIRLSADDIHRYLARKA